MKKVKLKDVLVGNYKISLNKLIGKKVVDLIGYPSQPFDNDVTVFEISKVVFNDGTSISLQGEHDVAYLPADDSIKNMDDETLELLYNEINGE